MYSSPLFLFLESLWNSQNPFVAFRLPDSKEIMVYFQQNKELKLTEDWNDSGFVMAPFQIQKGLPFIPSTHSKSFLRIQSDGTNPTENKIFPSTEGKEAFISLVQKTINEINKGRFKKVVVSRETTVRVDLSPPTLFLSMEQQYAEAMTYLWHHPQVGTWLGASPEQLLLSKRGTLQSMALAGTQLYQPKREVEWKNKEREEQRLVVEQVLSDLQKYCAKSDIQVSTPFNKQAGNLVHLCTEFRFPQNKIALKKWVKALHPTPAIGGIPKTLAQEFITQQEGYDRSFYSGFLGPIEETSAQLFVNLRCAQWRPQQLILYIGAGITAKSIPEQEWEETQRKAETLLRIL
ncbi:MAG: isochorismate synthase [Flavobacteriaceae bacterium]